MDCADFNRRSCHVCLLTQLHCASIVQSPLHIIEPYMRTQFFDLPWIYENESIPRMKLYAQRSETVKTGWLSSWQFPITSRVATTSGSSHNSPAEKAAIDSLANVRRPLAQTKNHRSGLGMLAERQTRVSRLSADARDRQIMLSCHCSPSAHLLLTPCF